MLPVASITIHLLPDVSFFLQLVIFLLALVILNRLVVQPAMRVLDWRHEYTDSSRAEAASLGLEAARLDDERTATIAAALRVAHDDRVRRISEAHKEAEEMVAEARAQGKEIEASADLSIESSEVSIVQDMNDQVGRISQGIVDRLLGGR